MSIQQITLKIIPNYRSYSKWMARVFIPPTITWGIAYCLHLERNGKIHSFVKNKRMSGKRKENKIVYRISVAGFIYATRTRNLGIDRKSSSNKIYHNRSTFGFPVDIIDFGATLVRVIMPDRQGELADINFGQNDPEKYSDRILWCDDRESCKSYGNAKFDLEGVRSHLFPNNANKHNLHGGERGFNRHWWECLKTDCNERLCPTECLNTLVQMAKKVILAH